MLVYVYYTKKKISVLPEMAVHGYLSTILNIDLVFPIDRPTKHTIMYLSYIVDKINYSSCFCDLK